MIDEPPDPTGVGPFRFHRLTSQPQFPPHLSHDGGLKRIEERVRGQTATALAMTDGGEEKCLACERGCDTLREVRLGWLARPGEPQRTNRWPAAAGGVRSEWLIGSRPLRQLYRSPLMNRKPIPVLAVCVAFSVAGCSHNATSPPTLMPVPTSVSDEITSLGAKLNQRDEELTHMGRGASLLLTLSTDPERYRPLIDFLTIIDEDEFRCLIIELTDYPLVLYAFHRSYVFPDGSHRPVFDRKSGLVLVDAGTRRAIDYVVGTGYRTEEHVSGEPWTTEWQQQDGARVRYRILTSGFERIWDDAPERNGAEPNDGEQSNRERSPVGKFLPKVAVALRATGGGRTRRTRPG